MAQLTKAFPDRNFSGIGGISDFNQAASYFLLGCGTVQVCTAAMLDQAVGPNVIKRLLSGLDKFIEEHAKDGWKSVEDFRGIRRDRIVLQSEIRRPDSSEYFGLRDGGSYAAHSPKRGRAWPVTIPSTSPPRAKERQQGASGARAPLKIPPTDHVRKIPGPRAELLAMRSTRTRRSLRSMGAATHRRGSHAVAIRRNR
jgi:hypothetical protein